MIPGLDDNHLLGRPSFDPINEPAQIDRLLQWLSAHKDDDRPKFIVIQNVVFLSGDIHCSNIARINFSGSPEVKTLKAFSITSSAFYWPYPFADGEPSN
jgi:alkaline phosphatase D